MPLHLLGFDLLEAELLCNNVFRRIISRVNFSVDGVARVTDFLSDFNVADF
jgi:hypothetical protein